MTAVLLGLFSAVFYGAADFCGGLATKRTAMLSVTVISQAAGLAILALCLPFLRANAGASDYLWGAGAGICGAIGIALLYHALSIGKMGVVSPITAVLAATFPVLYGFLRGDRLADLQLIGILIALIAVIAISASTEESGEREFSTRGVKEAIVSGLFIGGFFILLASSHASAGLSQLLAARISSVAFLLIVAYASHTDLRPRNATLPLILLGGTLDMAGNALYVFATYHGALAIAAVLTSLYPASTVLLARIVLKERLQWIQKCGVGLALVGVVLIAYA